MLGVAICRGGVGGRKKSETWASAKSLSISDTIVLAFSKMSSMKICYTKRDNVTSIDDIGERGKKEEREKERKRRRIRQVS